MLDRTPMLLIAQLAAAIRDRPDTNQLLSLIALRVLEPLNCKGVIIGVIRKEGFLDIAGSFGYKETSVSPFISMPLWTSLPITDAARFAEKNFFATKADLLNRYPHLSSLEEGEGSTISIPLFNRSTVIGALGFTTGEVFSWEPENSAYIDAVSSLCSIHILDLLNEERKIKSELERSDAGLSERQKQILHGFEENLTTDQIANNLGFSNSTIKQDIMRIYDYFGVKTRGEALDIARRVRLLRKND